MKNRGYTLLEMMIVVVVMVIILSIVFASFTGLSRRQAVDSSTELVRSVLEKARTLTLSSQGGSQYGVHFDANQVVLFKGGTYSANGVDNATTTIDSKVIISNIKLNGSTTEVVFKRLTGNTDNYGSTTISLSDSTSTKRVITITQTGAISQQ